MSHSKVEAVQHQPVLRGKAAAVIQRREVDVDGEHLQCICSALADGGACMCGLSLKAICVALPTPPTTRPPTHSLAWATTTEASGGARGCIAGQGCYPAEALPYVKPRPTM